MSGCVLDALLCNPPKYIYDLSYATASDRAQHCLSNNVQYGAFMYQAALLFTTDIMILLLPLPALLKLKMSRGRGLALILIFGSGQYQSDFIAATCKLYSLQLIRLQHPWLALLQLSGSRHLISFALQEMPTQRVSIASNV